MSSGLTLKDSGGDGIYVNGSKELRYSENVHFYVTSSVKTTIGKGISVISAENLIVENCTFLKHMGNTTLSSGLDIEPDLADQRIKNVHFCWLSSSLIMPVTELRCSLAHTTE